MCVYVFVSVCVFEELRAGFVCVRVCARVHVWFEGLRVRALAGATGGTRRC